MSFAGSVRRRAGSAVINGFFRGAAGAGKLFPRARKELARLEIVRDVPYRETNRAHHHLDVYRSRQPAAGPRPVVMYVHGGGFRILSKDTHWIMALVFARSGYLVFNVNYRLAPRHPFPAALEDTCAAYSWVVENAARYGGDPEQIVLAGESAGANLVTSLAIAATHERPEPYARSVWDTGVVPRAVVPACGLFQVSDTGRFLRRKPAIGAFVSDRLDEVSRGYLRGVDERTAAMDLADPLLLLERGLSPARKLPPFFVPCGTKDPVLDDTRRLHRALSALDVPCTATYYEGEPHAFHAFVPRPNAMRCWRDTFAFLAEHGVPAPHG